MVLESVFTPSISDSTKYCLCSSEKPSTALPYITESLEMVLRKIALSSARAFAVTLSGSASFSCATSCSSSFAASVSGSVGVPAGASVSVVGCVLSSTGFSTETGTSSFSFATGAASSIPVGLDSPTSATDSPTAGAVSPTVVSVSPTVRFVFSPVTSANSETASTLSAGTINPFANPL